MQVICILAGKVATAEREDEKFFQLNVQLLDKDINVVCYLFYRIYSIIIPIYECHTFGQAKVYNKWLAPYALLSLLMYV